MSSSQNGHASIMDHLYVSLDSTTLDHGMGKRKLGSIEPNGSLTYDEGQTAEGKLTETLQRIWSEYPGGMLDISESAIAAEDPDEPAASIPSGAKESENGIKEDEGKEMNMTFEDMARLRETILGQLNQSRNEMWYVMELANSLSKSGSFTNHPPAPPSLLPPTAKSQTKAKPLTNGNADIKIPSSTQEELVIPAGTFSTTTSLPPSKSLLTEMLELETALAAKQAALERCGKMIDSAVDELTTMTTAGDTFWADIKRLKEGRRGRGQWAVVPKPDFGRIAEGQKAKDVIIPYAIDEAFDLDPKKKELAYGARSNLRLRLILLDEHGVMSCSRWPKRVSEDADAGEKMEEAQMEAFDEELFGEIKIEITNRGNGIIEPRSVNFDISDQNMTFELIDTSKPSSDSPPTTNLCNQMINLTRMSFLQLLRVRKQRLTSGHAGGSSSRNNTVLAPLAQMRQYHRLVQHVEASLELLQRTLSSAGVECRLLKRMSLDTPEAVIRILEDSSMEGVGATLTLEIKDCFGVMLQVSPPNVLFVTTDRAQFSTSDTSELLTILTDCISTQLMTALLPVIRKSATNVKASRIFFEVMEETIELGEQGSLRLSIPPPFDAIQAKIIGSDVTFDGRKQDSLYDWARTILT